MLGHKDAKTVGPKVNRGHTDWLRDYTSALDAISANGSSIAPITWKSRLAWIIHSHRSEGASHGRSLRFVRLTKSARP
jgi:hypothetical protein